MDFMIFFISFLAFFFLTRFIDNEMNKFIYFWSKKRNKNILHYFIDIFIFVYKIFRGLLHLFAILIILDMIFGNNNNNCED